MHIQCRSFSYLRALEDIQYHNSLAQMVSGIFAVTSQNESKDSVEEVHVKNQSVLLIDTTENYLEHFELKRNTWFSVENFSKIILLLRDPDATLLEKFMSKGKDSPLKLNGRPSFGESILVINK